MEHNVKLVCSTSGEEQVLMTVAGGLGGQLDWTAVKEAFCAEVVQIMSEGILPCFQAGKNTWLIRKRFAGSEYKVAAVKKGALP